MARETIAWEWLPSIILWWDQVTLTPEDNKIIVFKRGTLKGLKTSIPIGGQTLPNSMLGARLLWKKAQKNDKKNITSEIINSLIPHRRPFSTIDVWRPWNLASRLTSRHHCLDTTTKSSKLIKNRCVFKWWNQITMPEVNPSAPIADKIGQGDSSTIWNGWLIKFDIYCSLFKILILEIKEGTA